MKKKIYRFTVIVFVLIFALLVSCAQKTAPVETKAEFSAERMMETISLMSAEDSGRIAGFSGEAKTGDYIHAQFESMGLDVERQYFPVLAFACDKVSIELDSVFEGENIEVKVMTFSAPTPIEGIEAEVIPVGFGAEEDYGNLDASGKIALIMRGGEYFGAKAHRAYENGALAAVIYDPNGDEPISATLGQPSAIPSVSISRSTAVGIEEAIESGKNVTARIIVDSESRNAMSSNVIAIYDSKDNPDDKYVVVGAHYDGVDTPAANDNATGTAVIMEIARYLTDMEAELPFDVRFIAFGAEEIGLLGSEAYTGDLDTDEREVAVAMINYDMVGAGEYFEILTVEGTDNYDFIESAKNVLEAMEESPVFSYTDRSDHASFSRIGVQAAEIQMSPALHYNTDLDTIDIVDSENLIKMCQFGAGMLLDELPGWLD